MRWVMLWRIWVPAMFRCWLIMPGSFLVFRPPIGRCWHRAVQLERRDLLERRVLLGLRVQPARQALQGLMALRELMELWG